MMDPNYPHAVYRHIDADGAVLYVGCSYDPASRFALHRTKSHWATSVVRIDIEWHPNRKTALIVEAAAIAAGDGLYNGRNKVRPKNWKPNNGHLFVADWLSFGGMTLAQFADACGISLQNARQLSTVPSHPQSRKTRRIAIVTGGYVPTQVWDNDYASRPARPFVRLTPDRARACLAENLAFQASFDAYDAKCAADLRMAAA